MCVCIVITLALAVTNSITAPIIEKNENAAANDALLVVMPDGKSFEKLDISGYTLPATVVEAYKAEAGGYVIKLETTGYASGFVIMCGVGADGKALCVVTNYSEDDNAPSQEVRLDFGRDGNFEVYLLDKDHDAERIETPADLVFTLPIHSCIFVKEV